ncbi:ABC transporter ATP-binding protein [Fodinicurvata fenggangensis]|uniref:ABC transporter ATP-binding protein n=1 Tax=Fodinicurvata fenggangensis TaxID=1121830 RepID=UPI00047A0A1E|nr:ABC transporter ATP-binding protein [Fodinicurvata fenggangensis]
MLEIKGLTKTFSGFTAVDNASLIVKKGDIHGVIGPNGAGKSTLFNLITGHLIADTGEVRLHDKRLTGLAPHAVVRRGLGRSFQRISVFPRMTVWENVQIALVAKDQQEFCFWKPLVSQNEQIARLLETVRLEDEAQVVAGELSYGRQKQLELALALAGEPHVLLLDEPTAGMSPRETEDSILLITRIVKDRGVTLLFTEHDMNMVFGIANRITVLHHGAVIASDSPDAVRENSSVQEVYLGRPTH